MISKIAHEIRNPLNIMINLLESPKDQLQASNPELLNKFINPVIY